MLKCQPVGLEFFLFADLQEPCFVGVHLHYVVLLTIPQIVLYVIGIPLCALFIILKNKEHLHTLKTRTRYGLLYRGYGKGREWWEIIVTLRKVAMVCVGTFGSLMGAVEVGVIIF